MAAEREFQILPLVPESIMHNGKALSNLQSLTASLFGVTAGILGLESYTGFLVYLVLSVLTSLSFYALKIAPQALAEGRPMFDTSQYFRGAFEFWAGGIINGFSGFILTWTLFYGLVRA